MDQEARREELIDGMALALTDALAFVRVTFAKDSKPYRLIVAALARAYAAGASEMRECLGVFVEAKKLELDIHLNFVKRFPDSVPDVWTTFWSEWVNKAEAFLGDPPVAPPAQVRCEHGFDFSTCQICRKNERLGVKPQMSDDNTAPPQGGK